MSTTPIPDGEVPNPTISEQRPRLVAVIVLIAAAYNAGGGAVRGWLRKTPDLNVAFFVEDIPVLQTRDYTKRVVGSYLAYQWLLGADAFDTRAYADVTRP